MSWVIVNTETGEYVAPPGQISSYTKDIRKALRFAGRETAEANRCIGNERVVSVESCLQPEVK